MSTAEDSTNTQRPRPSVFLSYASQDRKAAQLIRDALPSYGLDVWYDESDLTGGDAWDQKIRRQIRECVFFMPVISAQTEARHEGYFRREWRVAVERTLDMADDHTFILPVVIDDTTQAGARVPEKFLTVQWSRLPGGQPTPAFEALCRRLAEGETRAPPSPQQASVQLARTGPQIAPQAARRSARQPAQREYPEFPHEEPGQKTRFWLRVIGWALQSVWVAFNRFPKWVRVIAYIWLFGLLLARGCNSHDTHVGKVANSDEDLSPATIHKIKEIADKYQKSPNRSGIADLAANIAREVAKDADKPAAGSPLLAIPFTAPAEDPAARSLADSTFAQLYGRVAVSHHGKVGLTEVPLPSLDPEVARERGRANHSDYVLYGAIDDRAGVQSLSVKILTVDDGSILWSQSYPVAGADAAKIAAEVDSKVPSLTED
jgi:TolB-like protein